MRTDSLRQIRHLMIVIGLAFISQGIDSAEAAVFCVTDSNQLQSALSTAQGNGEADEIRIAQGAYTGNFTYESQESLTVRGGYAADCSSRAVDPSNTVLSGGFAGTVLRINIEGAANFDCDGVAFQNGSAARGGGLHITTSGNVALSNNAIYGNHAVDIGGEGAFGGGMNISANGTITLSHNTIYNNESDGYGGGASIQGGALVMTANVIRGNRGDGAAGGINASCSSVSVINNLFYGNSATWYHGAILVEGDSIRVINNTMAYNYAEGIGAGLTVMLTEDSDSAVIYNNIIYGNSGYWEGNDLCILNDQNENGVPSPASLLNNDFDQSAAGTHIAIPFSIDPSNLNNSDPLFVNAGGGDYRLAQGSPCIDAGTSTDAPATDIAGTVRPQGMGYDMGAYEYTGSPRPDIKANGQDGPLVIGPNDPVSITVSFNAGDKLGSNADWWIAVYTPLASSDDWQTYVYPTGWQAGVNLCIQIPLFNLSTLELPHISLPSGNHTFYFAVDAPDGNPSGPWFGLDYVNIQVQ